MGWVGDGQGRAGRGPEGLLAKMGPFAIWGPVSMDMPSSP